jgi:hypothetical protein
MIVGGYNQVAIASQTAPKKRHGVVVMRIYHFVIFPVSEKVEQ